MESAGDYQDYTVHQGIERLLDEAQTGNVVKEILEVARGSAVCVDATDCHVLRRVQLPKPHLHHVSSPQLSIEQEPELCVGSACIQNNEGPYQDDIEFSRRLNLRQAMQTGLNYITCRVYRGLQPCVL